MGHWEWEGVDYLASEIYIASLNMKLRLGELEGPRVTGSPRSGLGLDFYPPSKLRS